jgi:hypothetical protein
MFRQGGKHCWVCGSRLPARRPASGNLAGRQDDICPHGRRSDQNGKGHPRGMPHGLANTATGKRTEAAMWRSHAALFLVWTLCQGVAQSAVLGVVLKRAENATAAFPTRHFRDRFQPPVEAAPGDMPILGSGGQAGTVALERSAPEWDQVTPSVFARLCIRVGGALWYMGISSSRPEPESLSRLRGPASFARVIQHDPSIPVGHSGFVTGSV